MALIRGGRLFAMLGREGGRLFGGGRLLERGRLFEEMRNTKKKSRVPRPIEPNVQVQNEQELPGRSGEVSEDRSRLWRYLVSKYLLTLALCSSRNIGHQ